MGRQSTMSIVRTEDIHPRVLCHTHGSGNWGEQADDAAYYTIERLPGVLTSAASSSQPPLVRRDIDLGSGGLAFIIDNVITPSEADALMACSDAIFAFNGNSRVAPGIHTPAGMRQNMAAHWFPTPAEECETLMFGPIYSRFKHLLPATLDSRPLYSQLNQKLAVFKYKEADQFLPHVDGQFPGSTASADSTGVVRCDGVESGLSMLLYLNDSGPDDVVGGETRLYHMGTRPEDGEYVDVAPRKGSALFFRHGNGHDSVLHAGLPVKGGCKYMVKMNVLYGTKLGDTRVE